MKVGEPMHVAEAQTKNRIPWLDTNLVDCGYAKLLLEPRYEVRVEWDRQGAPDLLQRFDPDLIVAKLDLFEMENPAVLSTIHSRDQRVPFLAVIMFPVAGDFDVGPKVVQAIKAGASDVLLMDPLYPERLSVEVENTLER
jgi:DNA-binding NtrC family response regulator